MARPMELQKTLIFGSSLSNNEIPIEKAEKYPYQAILTSQSTYHPIFALPIFSHIAPKVLLMGSRLRDLEKKGGVPTKITQKQV